MSRTQAIILFTTLSVATASTLQAQSLAEAAQKEAARRKEVKGTGRVITNKDLPNVPLATASAPVQAAAPATPAADRGSAAPGQAKDAQPSKDGATGSQRDEKYWRERIASAKAEVQRNQIFIDALQSRINALTTDFVNRDDPAQRAVLATERQKAVDELDRLKKAIVDGTKAVADIEEEARRAGVPAGWLR